MVGTVWNLSMVIVDQKPNEKSSPRKQISSVADIVCHGSMGLTGRSSLKVL